MNYRKCIVSYYENERFYFHKWIEEGNIIIHPENPAKDSTYVETKGLLENAQTGEVITSPAQSITFVNYWDNEGETRKKIINQLKKRKENF